MQRSISIGGLSHLAPIPVATRVGPLVTCSITSPYLPGERICPAGPIAQVRTIFGHFDQMLRAAGGAFSDVAKITFYAPDPSVIMDAVNEVWIEHFPDPAARPSRHTMKVVEEWAGDMLLCADFVAYITDRQ